MGQFPSIDAYFDPIFQDWAASFCLSSGLALLAGSIPTYQQPKHHPDQQFPCRYLETSHKICKKARVATLELSPALSPKCLSNVLSAGQRNCGYHSQSSESWSRKCGDERSSRKNRKNAQFKIKALIAPYSLSDSFHQIGLLLGLPLLSEKSGQSKLSRLRPVLDNRLIIV